MEYPSDDLRRGGVEALGAASAAATVVAALRAAEMAALDFGEVAGAAEAVAGLSTARDGYREAGEAIRLRHEDLDQRARDTAGQGDRLVADTAAVARSVASSTGRIADGMY